MNVEIKLIKKVKLKFELSSIQYQVKKNILAKRSRKKLILHSDLITLDEVVLPTKYTKFIEVYTAEGKKVEINKELPTTLKGKYRFVIIKKTLDIKKTVFFNTAFSTKTKLSDKILLENLNIKSNNVYKTRDLQKELITSENIIHFGSKFQYKAIQSKKIELDIQGLIILEEILEKNPLRLTKYIFLEITTDNIDLFFGPNASYLINMLNNISKKLDIIIYTDISIQEFEKFKKYEQISIAVLYQEVELLDKFKDQKTKSLKIDVNVIEDYQIEYTLNSLSRKKINVNYYNGITIVVESFEQLIHALVENLEYCLSNYQYLNLETRFALTIEQLNAINGLGCQNIILNNNCAFVQKEITGNTNVLLANSYPKYSNADMSEVKNCLNNDCKKQNVIFVIEQNNSNVSVIDGCLVLKLSSKHMHTIFEAFDDIDVVGFSNVIIDFMYELNSKITYNVCNLKLLEKSRMQLFKRQMWKIIGMPNIQFKFLSNDDLRVFKEEINVNQIQFKYLNGDNINEISGHNYFEINGKRQPIVVCENTSSIIVLQDAVYMFKYHNELLTNTIDVVVNGSLIQVTNKTQLHIPAGAILDTKGKKISISITGNQYNPQIFKKYRNEWIVNSSLSGKYIDFPNFYLGDYYTNYSGIYISPEPTAQMFTTNISLENKDKVYELYEQLLKSDKLIYLVIDESSQVKNIITTYNVLSNLQLSILVSQDEMYKTIKSKKLWKYVEVVR